MLTCEKCEKIIARYIIGSLPPWSRAAVTRHLDKCSPCQRIVDSHYRVNLLLERLPGDDPPDGLWNRVANEISEEKPGYDRVPSTPRDWRPSLLVAAAGLTAGILLGQTMHREEAGPSATFATVEQTSPRMAPVVHYHSRMASDHPLADPVSLAVYQTAAFRDTERLEGEAHPTP